MLTGKEICSALRTFVKDTTVIARRDIEINQWFSLKRCVLHALIQC